MMEHNEVGNKQGTRSSDISNVYHDNDKSDQELLANDYIDVKSPSSPMPESHQQKHKNKDENDEDEDNPPESLSQLKQRLLHMFLNEQVVEDIPLRLKMQNHGGWIPFAFLESYDKSGNLDLKLWEKAVAELPEMFEIKESKFRRREILPDMEKLIYSESLLLVFERNDIAYADVNPIMRTLRKQKDVFKGGVYRLFNSGHTNCPRDVARLLQQCPSLRQHTFVWYQLKNPQAALDHFREVEQPAAAAFMVVSLNEYMNRHQCVTSPRQRGITVSSCGGEDVPVRGNFYHRGGGAGTRGSHHNCGSPSPRKSGAGGRFDWSTVRQHSATKLQVPNADSGDPSAGAHSGDATPTDCGTGTSADVHGWSHSNNNNNYNNNTKARHLQSSASWRPRRRLAQSESDSGPLLGDGGGHSHSPAFFRPLHVHAVKGERPQFITRNHTSASSSGGQDGLKVKLARQPRPPSQEGGFNLAKLWADFAFFD